MKYIGFRIDDRMIKNNKVVEGFFVRGQRTTDYNWPLLKECQNKKEAIEYIKFIRDTPELQPVYGPNGYSLYCFGVDF